MDATAAIRRTVELSSIRPARPTQSVGLAQSSECYTVLASQYRCSNQHASNREVGNRPDCHGNPVGQQRHAAYGPEQFLRASADFNRFPLMQNLVTHGKVFLPLATSKDHDNGHQAPPTMAVAAKA